MRNMEFFVVFGRSCETTVKMLKNTLAIGLMLSLPIRLQTNEDTRVAMKLTNVYIVIRAIVTRALRS